ncbi:MAG: hypothetical protein LUC43_04715 [Burkholderiales bacterium]|nr:hypothetical protein [Burkholderiales bacterium]
MSTFVKWIIAILVFIFLLVGGYCALIWTQGQIFDSESAKDEFVINGLVIHTKVNITESDFYGRKFTLATEIQDLPVINYVGEVSFGWDPTMQLRVTGIPADPVLEKAVLQAAPVLNGDFNVRFWPTRLYGKIDPVTVETKAGPISLGKTNIDANFSYGTNVFSQKADIDSVVVKYDSESFRQPLVTFGPSRLDATIWPKQSKMFNLDLNLSDISVPISKLKVNDINFHTNLSRKGSDFLQTYVFRTNGTENLMNKPSPFVLKGDVIAQWPQTIDFIGLVSAIATGGQTQVEVTDQDLKELLRAFREGKASIVINTLDATAQDINFTSSGIVGDSKSQGVWVDLKVHMKAKDWKKLGFYALLIPRNTIDEQTQEVNANIVIKENNDMLQVLCNGEKLYEWPAKSILKELY